MTMYFHWTCINRKDATDAKDVQQVSQQASFTEVDYVSNVPELPVRFTRKSSDIHR